MIIAPRGDTAARLCEAGLNETPREPVMTNAARPTHVRYIILALTVVVAVLLYLDRFCLGYVTPYISEGMRLTSGEIGFMLGAFFLTYAFGQLPAGWLADRFGVRKMLSFYLLVWSVLTAFIGFADSFVVLILLRFGCGLFEAGACPAAAGLIRRWYPYHRRGLASGIVSLGGRIGGAITPALTGFLILLFMPISASSLISDPDKDILDAHKLAKGVLEPPNDRPVLKSVSVELKRTMSSEELALFTQVAALDKTPPTDAQLKGIADTVNRWIQTPNLFHGIDLTPIETKLNRKDLDALSDPATAADPAKTARVNRLVLEVLYSGSIRQLFGDGWQPVLIIYGAIGVMVAVIFFGFYRDTPRQHFMANEAEAELAESHDVMTEAANPSPPMSSATLWKCILTDVSLWASAVVQFGTNFGWIILGNLLALYLSEVHSVPEGRERGIMASLPFVVSLPMLLVGGFWTDWMTKHYGPRLGRMFPIAATRFVTAGAFLACYFLNNVWAVVGVLCVMSIVNDMGLPAIWGYNLDVGKRNVGVVLGWGNMWGNLGAFVSPIVLLRLRDHFATRADGYNAIFLTCAGVFVFIGIVSLFIDASKPIGETPKDPVVPAPLPPPSSESSAIQAGGPSVKSGAVREGEPQ
jgi:sugar phosphate permease